MKIQALKYDFAICKIISITTNLLNNKFCFIGKTDEEISLVCPIDAIPNNIDTVNSGWKAFRISGELDFSLIGIIAEISALLAQNDISIFAVSTFNTDYILVKCEKFNLALSVLESAGYEIEYKFV